MAEDDGDLCGSGRGAIAGCHGSVLWLRAMATFAGVDMVPLQGVPYTAMASRKNIRKHCLELLRTLQ